MTIVITPKEVREVAKKVEGLPANFDAAAGLEENRADIAIVAVAAVDDIVLEHWSSVSETIRYYFIA